MLHSDYSYVMNTMQIYAAISRFSVCIAYPVDLLHLLKQAATVFTVFSVFTVFPNMACVENRVCSRQKTRYALSVTKRQGVSDPAFNLRRSKG